SQHDTRDVGQYALAPLHGRPPALAISVVPMPDWTAADLPPFAGRTAIVTGANSGLGEVTARELARAAARMTGSGTGQVEVRQLDLQDLSSVRRFAEDIDQADVLINNAGIMAAD